MTESRGRRDGSLQPPLIACAAAIAATVLFFLTSKLVFSPVPWPDGSAFFLPALDLLRWPPQWRMHAQAAFVPSYDAWNFNLMPALPILLALAHGIGLTKLLGVQVALRLVSLAPLAAMAWMLLRFTMTARRGGAPWVAAGLALTLLWDPVLRWATLVVRTETWVSAFALWIATELARPRGYRPWRIAWALALAALFHFEAVLLVPPVALALWPWAAQTKASGSWSMQLKTWARDLWSVGARTALLLSPWLLTVLAHWGLFWDQMAVQFQRLEHGNPFTREAYLFFHSLFLSHGSAKDPPKFFNLAKAAYWLLWPLLSGVSVAALLRRAAGRSTAPPHALRALAYLTAWFFAALLMWVDKQEVWFCALNHYAIWPWLAATWVFAPELGLSAKGRASRLALGLAAAYGLISLVATVYQAEATPPEYSWGSYRKWLGCVERGILSSRGGESAIVWQPHVPDVLVELAVRHPRMDLTRALDFPARRELAWEHTRKIDVLLHSTHFGVPKGMAPESYEGPMRPGDRRMLSNEVEMPFGPFALTRLPAEQPGAFESRICQEGAFWAHLAIRR